MKTLTITRTFSAPIDTVWNAFTNADTLKKWWAPPGMTCSHASINLAEGGLFRYCFQGEDGKEFWGRGVYQTIKKPKVLSYLDTFTDSEGTPVPPSYFGMEGDEVVETLAEFHFHEDGDRTTMTLTGENYFDDAMTEEMTKGWNGMFDNLAKLLT